MGFTRAKISREGERQQNERKEISQKYPKRNIQQNAVPYFTHIQLSTFLEIVEYLKEEFIWTAKS